MDAREFSYRLAKILTEELPFDFKVELERYKDVKENHYPIYVFTPEDYRELVDIPKNTYIGMDHLPNEEYEVYVRIGSMGYKNFGKVKTPNQVSDSILRFFSIRFAKEIKQISDSDFIFSAELRDFLAKNDYSSQGVVKGSPDLIKYNHSITNFGLQNITIQFNEYRGNVLVVMYCYYLGPNNSSEEVELYRSKLSIKNQQNVFADILKEIRKSDLPSDSNSSFTF